MEFLEKRTINNEKTNRIFITGDTHGDFDFLTSFCSNNNTTVKDILIILGDSGINYFKGDKYKKLASRFPITLFCIRGNHEDRPQNRKEYELVDVGIGDKIYLDHNYPNLWFAQDGGEYFINNFSFLTIGGAYSVDKNYRIATNKLWFEDEMLNKNEQEKIFEKIENKNYDFVLTHTCPLEWQPKDKFLPFICQAEVDTTMEKFLTKIKNSIIINKKWFFGHYHCNRKEKEYCILFDIILELTDERSYSI